MAEWIAVETTHPSLPRAVVSGKSLEAEALGPVAVGDAFEIDGARVVIAAVRLSAGGTYAWLEIEGAPAPARKSKKDAAE